MTYALIFSLPARVPLASVKDHETVTHSREDALARLTQFSSDLNTGPEPEFFGISEGMLLAEEAHERGYETESWVLDAGLAPHERDWLSHEKTLNVTAYYKTDKSANAARTWLKREYALKPDPQVLIEEEQDWNAKWKAAFTGIDVDEHLRVLPPWHEEWLAGKREGIIAINPGAGFGTGTHETTQLCLRILRSLGSLEGKTVLDFGSGSGILGVAAALQGATVYCVEIDTLANDNARENAALNQVEHKIKISESIPAEIRGGKVDVLIANILRPILLQFAPEIKDCLKPNGELVLSGLIESDLDQVIKAYQAGGQPFEVTRSEKNEWRALWLRRLLS